MPTLAVGMFPEKTAACPRYTYRRTVLVIEIINLA
jgi:hypothetical protein